MTAPWLGRSGSAATDELPPFLKPGDGSDRNGEVRLVNAATSEPMAWADRLAAAISGMRESDPDSLDAWQQAHADSATPGLDEAALVAVWEARQPAGIRTSDRPP